MKRRYWLRGGIIGLLIAVSLLVFIGFLPVYCIGLSENGTACKSPQGFEAFTYNINSLLNSGILAYFFLLPTALGIIVGWLYGKIKNHKKPVSSLTDY